MRNQRTPGLVTVGGENNSMAASTARFRLSLLALALAARCEAWVVFDAARLEKAVPDGQLAKNTSDVLTTGETMRLILSDGFPGSFRWSAQPAIRYAIAPDFCEAMKGTMIEEDGWLKDVWWAHSPHLPAWAPCHLTHVSRFAAPPPCRPIAPPGHAACRAQGS